MSNVHELEEPTTWAAPPEHYSYSKLQVIEACPRKWQLLHSTWGDEKYFPQRQHPKALEGRIVHEALKLLIRELSRRGLPEIGSARFQQAVADIDFWNYFAREIERKNEDLTRSLHAGSSFRLRTSPSELANQAIRLFREQYRPKPALAALSPRPARPEKDTDDLVALLRTRGALSEIGVSHPDLPFHGTIDLVEIRDGEILILDFKTGKHKESHDLQVQLYGVLWWRKSGVRPARLVVQYLDERKDFSVDEATLLSAEKRLREGILDARRLLMARPAEARPGKECGNCPVRARCEAGWRAHLASLTQSTRGTTDVELSILAKPSATGFLAKLTDREVDVVYQATVGQGLPRVEVGDRLRLLHVTAHEDGKTFEVHPWTEMYAVKSL